MISKEEREKLLEEYEILHDSIYRRGASTQTVNSILLPSSVLVMAIAIEFRERINSFFSFPINASGFLPLFSALLLFISLFYTFSAGRINEICFERIHEIEEILEIKGHRYIYSRIKSYWWWKVRRSLWLVLLPLAGLVSIIVSGYLFA